MAIYDSVTQPETLEVVLDFFLLFSFVTPKPSAKFISPTYYLHGRSLELKPRLFLPRLMPQLSTKQSPINFCHIPPRNHLVASHCPENEAQPPCDGFKGPS